MENNNKSPTILVFDSGVGGLTIFRALLEQTPDLEVIFTSDNAGFPYGTRTEYSLLTRVHRVLERLISKFSPDLVVIACNSASTVALPSLREKYEIPFVGVVPAVKPAVTLSRTGHIGILATPATISRDYTRQLVTDFAKNANVSMLGSSDLVEIAEQKLRGITPDAESLRRILEPFANEKSMDTLVMACTHFPLLLEDLRPHLPQVTNWIESGAAIARRVRTLIPKNSATPSSLPEHQAWLTAADPKIDELQKYLLQLGGKASLNLQIYPIDSND